MKLDEQYQDNDADIVCFGHHHVLHHFKSSERTYLNPGALGCNSKPVAPYAILNVKDNSVDCTVKEVQYDNREFLLNYERLDVPARNSLIRIFHGNQQA